MQSPAYARVQTTRHTSLYATAGVCCAFNAACVFGQSVLHVKQDLCYYFTIATTSRSSIPVYLPLRIGGSGGTIPVQHLLEAARHLLDEVHGFRLLPPLRLRLSHLL